MFHKILFIFLGFIIIESICQENIHHELINPNRIPALPRTSNRFIDIYTNHHNLQDILKNYHAIRGSNSRYLELELPKRSEHSTIRDRNDYHYHSHKTHSDKHWDVLQSDFGVILASSANKPQTLNDLPETGDKFIFNRERRPRFQTQRYNWPKTDNSSDLTRFSYIQKIPKHPSSSKVEVLSSPLVVSSKNSTKERINEMLKRYLSKLYAQKYQNFNTTQPSVTAVYTSEDENLKSKFFDETLWSLKNKTKLLASKLFGLFTVIQFSNTRCATSSAAGDYEGTCYTQAECASLGGTAMGNCASGYGVCCVFRGTCGGTGNQNCSYFESPNYPNYYPSDGGGTVVPTTEPPNGLTPDPRLHFYFSSRSLARQSNNALSCTYNVNKINNNIQQMRIDFIDLELTGPEDGTCTDERLVISGTNLNTQIPNICGYNTGQHVYVDVSMLTGPLQLSVLSAMGLQKRFKIRICQYAESCSNPTNCLQYYTGVTGTISSFNYDQASTLNRSTAGYFNNMNYAICIRREAGYCSITYTNVMRGTEYPFQMVNVDDAGNSVVPAGQAGADITNCPDDYIVIGGTRLCGDKFNDGSVNEDFTMNAPVTDTSSGPIVVQVHSNEEDTGLGFKLFYTQNRCT